MRNSSYPSLAQLIFNSGDDLAPKNRVRRPSKQETVPGYAKAGIPVKNPKIAANIEYMHNLWLQKKVGAYA